MFKKTLIFVTTPATVGKNPYGRKGSDTCGPKLPSAAGVGSGSGPFYERAIYRPSIRTLGI